ncbi:toll/interleukin-1 receptor domain-containing protein [Flagellimonas pacifica]|uniref:TIR domain-containing protein n=1 Tax=Flagellimonas pacifica TaxID=1247520 RepID=A0A285MSS3_9FLAO|nr:toll/interleukin-1 receptor domain-containing protein [Allomuricauda parva]SNZ00230.1 TIR domain-containing protein [Allomuricauda parva]
MKIGYIWYEESEKEILENIFHSECSEWTLESIHEQSVCTLNGVLNLLKSDYDLILVHLSLRFCLALKMVELAHQGNIKSKVVLFSRTISDENAVKKLFDGHIRPDRDLLNFKEIINKALLTNRKQISNQSNLEKYILQIFNSSDTLKSGYLEKFKIRHKRVYSIEDYHRSIKASTKPSWNENSNSPDIFISYASLDSEIATEIATMLNNNGISTFMAERKIKGGEDWEESIRLALVNAREIVIFITPHSVKSNWVMIEAGAAWALRKRITPCVAYIDMNSIPQPISSHQCRQISTTKNKELLVAEIVERFSKIY